LEFAQPGYNLVLTVSNTTYGYNLPTLVRVWAKLPDLHESKGWKTLVFMRTCCVIPGPFQPQTTQLQQDGHGSAERVFLLASEQSISKRGSEGKLGSAVRHYCVTGNFL